MKLYSAEGNLLAMFLSSQPDHMAGEMALKMEARKFLQEESKNDSFTNVRVKEIKTYDKVPEAWKSSGNGLWGIDDDVTVEQFFQDKLRFDPEYQTFLRLQKKFKGL